MPQEPEDAIGVITEISPVGRREGRFDVVVDGRRVAVLSVDGVERLGLHSGDEWTPALAERVGAESQQLRVFDRALAMLASRARSTRELRLGLLRKREPEALVEAAVSRLVALGALNDDLYARQFVRSRMTRSGFAPRRLQAELARRGISREAADSAIAEVRVDEELDPSETLERLAARRLRALSRLDPPTQRRRLSAYLARRGYELHEIRATLDRLGSIHSP